MGAPYFILASGQSNIHGQAATSWSPNARAKVWNNIIHTDDSVGSAYGPIHGNQVGIAERYAHNIAAADADKDVYLAKYARGAMDILHWVGGGIFTLNGSGDGGCSLNAAPNAATVLTMSSRDAYGIQRSYFVAMPVAGEKVFIKQGASVYEYTVTAPTVWDSNSATVYVSYVSGSGGLNPGGVMIDFQPRLLTAIENSVPAALAAAGKSAIDVFLWWQGESDSEYNTRYEIDFEFMLSYLGAKSWWSPETKVIICAMNSTANNGLPEADQFNTRLAALAAANPLQRKFANIAANVPSDRWADVYHMTAHGYSDAGDYLLNAVYTPPLVGSGGGGVGTIAGMSIGSSTTVMDFSSNGAHGFMADGTTAYGLWCDGAPIPYRDGSNNTYINIPHSENYRFKVPDWNNGASWELQGPTFVSNRDPIEGNYNNRYWIFGGWSDGDSVYSLAHHEWYQTTTSIGGIGGVNGYSLFNRRWVNGIGLVSSSNGGATHNVSPAANSSRLVLVPEPWAVQSRDPLYGFFHPSNIVKEGAYYYACVEQRSLSNTGTYNDAGVSIIRTTNVASAVGWEFWDGSSWQVVDHNYYQGNQSYQRPHRFFAQDNRNYYELPNNYNSHMGQCLRYHVPSGQWLMFGFSGTESTCIAYSASLTLANPQFTSIVGISSPDPSIYNSSAARFISVFDEAATDRNFVNIGNSCTVLATADYAAIKKGSLTITVNSAVQSYSIAPSGTSINEGQSVTFSVTTTNFGNGTLFWTNAGTTTGPDFSDGQNSGSLSITGDAGSLTRSLLSDGVSESAETIIIRLHTGSTSGPVVATAEVVAVASDVIEPLSALRIRSQDNGSWIIASESNLKIRNAANTGWMGASAAGFKLRNAANSGWLSPVAGAVAPTYAITPDATSVNEGETVTFNVTTGGLGSGTLYWTNAGTATSADFSDSANSGSVAITSNTGSFTKTLSSDAATEGGETIVMQLRTGSTSGPVVATSASVAVNDTSKSPYTPPNPYTLTMARNDLDFIYAADVQHNGGTYLKLNFVISFDDFFSAGADHIPICLNAEITDPHTIHCGTITRNGRNLFSYGRGFLIAPGADQVFAEHWNGTSSPGIEAVPNVGGVGFNPAVNSQVRVSITAGLRSGPHANKMLIKISKMDYSQTLFSGSIDWGWDPSDSYLAAIGGIGTDFVSTNDTGCVERSGAGANPTASATITDIVHQML